MKQNILSTFTPRLQARKMKQTLQQQGDNDEGICIRGPKKGTGIETDLASYCKALHRKSLDNLERYAMLIIFNAYLNRVKMYTDDHLAAPDECVTASFENWISEVRVHDQSHIHIDVVFTLFI